jgi:hypothetical protein
MPSPKVVAAWTCNTTFNESTKWTQSWQIWGQRYGAPSTHLIWLFLPFTCGAPERCVHYTKSAMLEELQEELKGCVQPSKYTPWLKFTSHPRKSGAPRCYQRMLQTSTLIQCVKNSFLSVHQISASNKVRELHFLYIKSVKKVFFFVCSCYDFWGYFILKIDFNVRDSFNSPGSSETLRSHCSEQCETRHSRYVKSNSAFALLMSN